MTGRRASAAVAQRSGPRLLVMLAALSALYTVPVLVVLHPVHDPDVWWHLRTGSWIVEQRAIPWTDPFSTQAGQPWIAYWWLFEILIYGFYSLFGIAGVLLFNGVLVFCITAALHALIHRYRPGFGVELAMTGVAIGAMLPVLAQPRPWLFTILFFVLELHILLAFRESHDRRLLLLLPPLFVLWGNVHIQFVYGLGLLGLNTAVAIFEEMKVRGGGRRGGAIALALATCGSALATVVNPYHVYVYVPVIDAVRLTDPFNYIGELQALPFRNAGDWLVLALAFVAAFLLGRRRTSVLFSVALLAGACALSFRAQRDAWVVVVVAITIIAQHPRRQAGNGATSWTPARMALVMATVLTILTLTVPPRISPRRLEAALAEKFPVAAAAFVEAHGYRGPMFNDYDWGGYLIWRLPHLGVSMDGRNTFYGDQRVWQSIRTLYGFEGWASDPELTAARIVIGRPQYPLSALLRKDERFERVYEDGVAVVFVAREARPERGPRPAAATISSAGPGRSVPE